MKKVIVTFISLLLVIRCQAKIICTAEISGDLDGNCKVDFDDFAIMGLDWGMVGAVIQAWARRYNGSTNNNDYARALAIDHLGNLYVTGSSKGSEGYYEYVTIKYDRNGNQIWEGRYDDPENISEIVFDIALDSVGNVYVTGGSDRYLNAGNFTTIEYDSNGNELWVAKYNGPGDGYDAAYAMVIDSSNNICVTGPSEGYGTGEDYVTIKYDPNGNELWLARYNSPSDGDDVSIAMALDKLDNLYITGWNRYNPYSFEKTTIKYDPNGTQLWVINTGGTAMAVDTFGNVYLASSSNKDIIITKCDTNGNQLWVSIYNGPAKGLDAPKAITVDEYGNVYVAGVTYDGASGDYLTIKYDTEGNELWARQYDGVGNMHDEASDIAVDNLSGDVYVTGGSFEGSTYTIKYDAEGNEKWVMRYEGIPNDFNHAFAIGLDGLKNVYITGGIGGGNGSGPERDYFTIKYYQIRGDFTNDGKVDLGDLAEFATHWLE